MVFLKDAQKLIATPLGDFLIMGIDVEDSTRLTPRVRQFLDGGSTTSKSL